MSELTIEKIKFYRHACIHVLLNLQYLHSKDTKIRYVGNVIKRFMSLDSMIITSVNIATYGELILYKKSEKMYEQQIPL